MLERLARRGLIEVTTDRVDRRQKLLPITPLGTDLLVRVAPKAVAVGEQMLEPQLKSGERGEVALVPQADLLMLALLVIIENGPRRTGPTVPNPATSTYGRRRVML